MLGEVAGDPVDLAAVSRVFDKNERVGDTCGDGEKEEEDNGLVCQAHHFLRACHSGEYGGLRRRGAVSARCA